MLLYQEKDNTNEQPTTQPVQSKKTVPENNIAGPLSNKQNISQLSSVVLPFFNARSFSYPSRDYNYLLQGDPFIIDLKSFHFVTWRCQEGQACYDEEKESVHGVQGEASYYESAVTPPVSHPTINSTNE